MGIFVIAPLVLDVDGQALVDGLRRAHDPHATLVEPHVTLVFAVEDAQEAAMGDWAAICAPESAAASLVFTWATAKLDYTGSAWYLFLMPESIPAPLADLERRLNEGSAKGAIVAPFDAHLTVGRFKDEASARRMAADLTASALRLPAKIVDLVVLRFDGVAERNRKRIRLGC